MHTDTLLFVCFCFFVVCVFPFADILIVLSTPENILPFGIGFAGDRLCISKDK